MARVYEKKFNRPEQCIMLSLADHAHDDGSHVFPSVPLVAWKTDYCERQVQRIMRWLISKQVLILVRHSTAKRPNEYRIDLSVVPDKPPFRPTPNDYNTDAVLHPQVRGDILTPLTSNVTPGVTSLSHPRGDMDVTLTINEPSIKPLVAALAATSSIPTSKDEYRQRVLNAITGGTDNTDSLTRAIETLTGRRIDLRNKTAAGYIANLREWGATPDRCRHFSHYATVVLNTPRRPGEDGWRGAHWRPTLKEVWELWETAMQWQPVVLTDAQIVGAQLEAQGWSRA